MGLLYEREINAGIQKVYRFKNNYGASVVRSPYSYTNGDEWELATIEFPDSGDEFILVYSTPITSDVIGHLTDVEVDKILKKIERL